MRQDHDLCFSLKYENVAWYEDGTFKLLNRRIYPVRTEFIRCTSYKEVAKAIAARFCEYHTAIAAAICAMALASHEFRDQKPEQRKESLKKVADILTECRPALGIYLKKYLKPALEVANKAIDEGSPADEAVMEYYVKILDEVYGIYANMAKHMADKCPEYGNILLIAPEEIYAAMLVKELNKQGKEINIFIPEQRPTCTGSRFISAAINEMKGEATVISDASIAFVMKRKRVKAYFNCTNICYEDGYGVSPIGGFQGALSAKYWGIPNYMVGLPIEGNIKSSLMALEEYRPAEVLSVLGHQVAYRGSLAYAPSHDVTPPDICDGIITDKGIFKADEISSYLKDRFDPQSTLKDDSDKSEDSSDSKEEKSEESVVEKASADDSDLSKSDESEDKSSVQDSKEIEKEASDNKESANAEDEKSEQSDQDVDSEKSEETKDKEEPDNKEENKEESKEDNKDDSDEKKDSSDKDEDTKEDDEEDDFGFEDLKIPDFSPEKLGKLEFSQIASEGIRHSKQSLGLLDSDSANIQIGSENKIDKLSSEKKIEDKEDIKVISGDDFKTGVMGMKDLSEDKKPASSMDKMGSMPQFPFDLSDEENSEESEANKKKNSASVFDEDDEPLPDFVKSIFSSSTPTADSSMDFLSKFDDMSFNDEAMDSHSAMPNFPGSAPQSNFSPSPLGSNSTPSLVNDNETNANDNNNKTSGEVLMTFSNGMQIRSFDDLDPSVSEELKKLNTPLENLDVKMVERMQKDAWNKRASSAINKAGDQSLDLSKVKKPNVKVNVSQVSTGYVPSADEFAKAREELEKMAGEIVATGSSESNLPKRKVDQDKKALIIDTEAPVANKHKAKPVEVMADLGLSSPAPASPSPAAPHMPLSTSNSAWKPVQNKNVQADKHDNKRGIFGNLFTRKNEPVVETAFSDIDLNPYDETAQNSMPINQSTDISLNDAMAEDDGDIPAWQISMLQKSSDE